MANGRYSSTPPAYNTRARDQVDRPITSELFVQSYSMISKLHLDSYSMSTHLHFLNQTLWSKNKHFKSLKTDSNTCDRCHVISNSEHHLADCTFPTAFSTSLETSLDPQTSMSEYVYLTPSLTCFSFQKPILTMSTTFNSSKYVSGSALQQCTCGPRIGLRTGGTWPSLQSSSPR